jgi:hypothetical protein
MAITYTWKIIEIRTKNQNNFTDAVVQTRWEKTGTDENNVTGFFPGATPFDADTIDPDNFTSLSDLTEEMVLGWIKAEVEANEVYETHINDHIAREIDKKVNIVTELEGDTLPWNT